MRQLPAYRLVASLLLLVAGYLLYKGAGTLLGTFRTDEIYFLHDAWSAYQGLSEPRGLPPHFGRLIEVYWFAIDGNVSLAWTLRIALMLAASLQGWLVFQMARTVMPRVAPLRNSLSLLIAAAFILVMCAYRGYEARPEVIPNTLILLAAYLLFFTETAKSRADSRFLVVAVSGCALIVAASTSFRHTLPAAALFLFIVFELIRTRNAHRAVITALVVGAWLYLLVYLNITSFDILDGIRHANTTQQGRSAKTALERLAFGGGKWHLYAKATLLLALILAAGRTMTQSKAAVNERFVTLFPFLALIGYYVFLLTVDINPFEYVRSIEWALLAIAVCLVFKCATWTWGNRLWLGTTALAVVASTAVLTDEAINSVDRRRNSDTALTALLEAKSTAELRDTSDSELARLATTSVSVIDQMRARGEYCRRHPDGLALVHSFNLHPICLGDAGSLALTGWQGPIDLGTIDLARIQWLGLPPDRIQSLEQLLADFHASGAVYVRIEPQN